MLNKMTATRINVLAPERSQNGILPAKNIEITAIRVGNLPLQGEKLLVRAAIFLSASESMILHPVTPQALQPNPIIIVRACLPFVPDFLKMESRLNATLGRYPRSSNSVNKGKNIAIGGNMTATTLPRDA